MLEIVSALGFRELVEDAAAEFPELIDGPFSRYTVWSTVTPFVFDRYPQDPYGEEAEQIVRDAFARIGLLSPRSIDLHYNPWQIGVPRAAAFPPAPARPGKPQRYHCHVRILFDRQVAGPIIAGAGRYYGYGLFRPIADWGNTE